MNERKPPKPILARPAEDLAAGVSTKAPVSKPGPVDERPVKLDMASARARARSIRSNLEGRPRAEDSTEIIRKLRDA